MPTIASFFGMVIQMYWHDHQPAHFHVKYKGRKAVVIIETGQIMRGSMAPGAARILREWTARHRQELLDNWERCTLGVSLWTIPGADQE